MSDATIEIENLNDGCVLPHQLVLIEGRVVGLPACHSDASVQRWYISAHCTSGHPSEPATSWPVAHHSGRFKAMVLFPSTPGSYSIQLDIPLSEKDRVRRMVPIVYTPLRGSHRVRYYYYKGCDSANEGFDAPEGMDNSDQAAVDRIRLCALINQLTLGEMLAEAWRSRKSFELETDATGRPRVDVVYSRNYTTEALRQMDDGGLWQAVQQDLAEQGFHDAHGIQYQHVVLLGCSHWDQSAQRVRGHTALSYGKVSLFGSGTMHTWPRKLQDLTMCLLDNAPVDALGLFDDSAGRRAFWANCATGLGCPLHMLLLSLGLRHGEGYMSRGFDELNRMFAIYQPVTVSSSSRASSFSIASDSSSCVNLDVLTEAIGHGEVYLNRDASVPLLGCAWVGSILSSVRVLSYESHQAERCDQSTEEWCPICLVEYANEDELSELECNHAFHSHCVKAWLDEKHTCPLCKRFM